MSITPITESSPEELDPISCESATLPPVTWQKLGALEVCLIAIGSAVGYVYSSCRKRKGPHFQAHFPPNNASPPLSQLFTEPLDLPVPPSERPPLAAPPPKRFADLPLPTEHKEMIEKVVTELARMGYLNPFTAFALNKIKPKILYIHPFKFLWTAFSNPRFRQLMKDKVQYDFIAKNGYIAGVNEGMRREIANRNIEPYLAEFAAEVGSTPEELRPLIELGHRSPNPKEWDWTALVDHLISKC